MGGGTRLWRALGLLAAVGVALGVVVYLLGGAAGRPDVSGLAAAGAERARAASDTVTAAAPAAAPAAGTGQERSSGRGPSAPGPAAIEETADLMGFVTDEAHTLLTGARVRIRRAGAPERVTVTDGVGSFAFDAIAEGVWEGEVTADGQPTWRGALRTGPKANWIRMVESVRIPVVLRATEGPPPDPLEVGYERLGVEDAFTRLFADDVEPIEPGARRVVIRFDRSRALALGRVRVWVLTTDGGLAASEVFDLAAAAGAAAPGSLTITFDDTQRVRGTVVAPDGTPISNAEVRLQHVGVGPRPAGAALLEQESGGPERLVDANGAFDLRVPDFGDWILSARAQAHGWRVCPVSAGPAVLRIVLLPDALLRFVSGRILDRDGVPVAAARVCLTLDLYGMDAPDLEMLTETDGTFTHRASTWPGRYLATVTHDDHRLATLLPVDLPADPESPIEIRLPIAVRWRTLRVQVRAPDGGTPEIGIAVAPVGGPTGAFVDAVCGRIAEVRVLDAASYAVHVYPQAAGPVTCSWHPAPAGDAVLLVDAVPGVRLTGRIEGVPPELAERFTICAWHVADLSGRQLFAPRRWDTEDLWTEEGLLASRAMPPGIYEFALDMDDRGLCLAGRFTVSPTQATATLRWQAPGSLEGRLLDGDRSPVGGAVIRVLPSFASDPGEWWRTWTTADGRFRVPNPLPASNLRVIATVPGSDARAEAEVMVPSGGTATVELIVR